MRKTGKLAVSTCAGLLAMTLAPANAQTVVDSWKSIPVPPPPAIRPVTVSPSDTALVVMDMYARTCTVQERPRCVRMLPTVERLLKQARARDMFVVYTGSLSDAISSDPVPSLKPRAGEPMARGPADKFLGSDLEQLLKQRGIKKIIAVGTSADGVVMYSASHAAMLGLTAIVPVDAIASIEPFAELYTVWHLANTASTVSKNIVITRTDQITIR